jgi:hypothetical protein
MTYTSSMADTRIGVGLALSLSIALSASCSDDNASTASNSGGFTSTGGSKNGGTGSNGTGGINVGGGINVDSGPPSTQDSDDDGMTDVDEGTGDFDNDGIPNDQDPINDGPPPAIQLIAISTIFNSPIGIDYHEPTNSVVMSVNYPAGTPSGFERIELDGTHQQFSGLSALTDEVKIATARSGNPGGFTVGDLFVGNGVDGQIVRITDGGNTVINPWVDLPGDGNGLMRGSLYVDRTGEWAGDLCVVTTTGQVWRVTAAGVPTPIASVGVHLEGAIVVPNKPVRFGPMAGKLIAGSESEGLIYAFSTDGSHITYSLGVAVEDIDIISPKENFFGVNFGTGQLLGAASTQFQPMMGDVLLTTESVTPGTSNLFRLKFDGTQLLAEPIPLAAGSATVGQWEHTTFAAAGIKEIPPPPK